MNDNTGDGSAQADELVFDVERVFDVPRETLFRAWTDPALLVKWWGPKSAIAPVCETDARVGGGWRATMQSKEGRRFVHSGIYKEISPPERLVMTWAWEVDGERGHETILTVQFVESGTGTQMLFHHSTFSDSADRDKHINGWTMRFEHLDKGLSSGDIR